MTWAGGAVSTSLRPSAASGGAVVLRGRAGVELCERVVPYLFFPGSWPRTAGGTGPTDAG